MEHSGEQPTDGRRPSGRAMATGATIDGGWAGDGPIDGSVSGGTGGATLRNDTAAVDRGGDLLEGDRAE